jgi:DNA-binding transcriptional ArsR family regulator
MATTKAADGQVAAKAARAREAEGGPLTPAQARRVAWRFKQVNDPTRLRLLLLLSEREWSGGELSGELGITPTGMGYHVELLRLSGLVVTRRQGKYHVYGLTDVGEALVRAVSGVVDGAARR